MYAGVAISKSDDLRPLLERADIKLTGSQHLRDYIPKIESLEYQTLTQELCGQAVFLMFDGTRRLGEALNTVARFCNAEFEIILRLVQFITLEASPDNLALSATLTNLVIRELGLPFEAISGWGRDSVKVNGTALSRLSVIFLNSTDLLCICHTLNNTGERVGFPEKRDFMTAWLILVLNNNTAKKMWKSLTQHAMVGYSTIRWWSRQEVENEISENWHHVPNFLHQLEDEGVGDATTRRMLEIYAANPLLLEVSFAAGYDGTAQLLRTTYEMEGDRLEILLVFRRVEAVRAFGRSLGDPDNRGILPNVDAVIRRAMVPTVGTSLEKEFPGHGVFSGKITKIDKEDPEELIYHITYEDGDTETMQIAEVLPLLSVVEDQLRNYAIEQLRGAYEYLEKRLTGECDSSYDCRQRTASW
ncbi:hypothetical protein CYMTET_43856 [Cymbomonas tetramitiformis]|uniref:PTM/DIR17-like Tudor domain-containing protein n=1 Tax=Cymbomonas tetramitiformis TaxID=36881 RepID=A0AAE0C2H4_9CHLO|nr:hypothetical protein CYMTET_43856 [Cymbomonas tetramitiformis]